ncbi:uncharacterized protein N7479_004863 [Penicillium vulpinum]|uniref:uncharacterized protein n=1 Tax=Penicillium vulpinum TaxID=29845 RepID=UPI0025480574|nr:uncharacterized protein N7479_004863 [Penicillium vulpinum]KAJ5964987.1 hypothetical protein N7479_004863 [Penicillium vulpinum]
MHQSSALRVPGVDKTVAGDVFFSIRILISEAVIVKFTLSIHILTFIRSPGSETPVPSTHQSSRSNNVITGRHSDDLRQSNNHPNFPSPLREHSLSPDDCSTSSFQSSNLPYTAYAFVKSQQLLSLPSKDIEFLTSSGCLSLPPSDAIDEFVQQYFKRVHPLLPVLDEAEFWRMYLNSQSTGPKISLFVLQSLLFASCQVSFK